MDQLIYASLSHTHYWYVVDMLKVPAYVVLPISVEMILGITVSSSPEWSINSR